MNESPFKVFIQLITFDQAIANLQVEEKKIAQEIASLQRQEQEVLAGVEAAKRDWQQAQKDVAAKELEMESLLAQETEKKRLIDTVSGHKEYKSIKAELDTLQEKQQQLEAILLNAWAQVETAARAHEHKKTASHTQLEALQGTLTERMAKRSELATTIEQREQERPALVALVPQEWLDKYGAMRARVANPVVPVINGVCTACDYKVSEQDLIMLGRNKLLQCKDCYRFLYIPERTVQP